MRLTVCWQLLNFNAWESFHCSSRLRSSAVEPFLDDTYIYTGLEKTVNGLSRLCLFKISIIRM